MSRLERCVAESCKNCCGHFSLHCVCASAEELQHNPAGLDKLCLACIDLRSPLLTMPSKRASRHRNEFIIAVFDRVRHEFVWFNRAYGKFRESYQQAIQSWTKTTPTCVSPPQDGIDGNAHSLVNRSWFAHDRLRDGKMAVLKQKERLSGIIWENATREGATETGTSCTGPV